MLDGVMRSFVFGATLAAAVGPIALLILGYGMRAGLKPALGAGLGAALADLTYALAAFTIGSLLLARLVEHERVFRLWSAAALVGVGVWLMVQAMRHLPATAGATGGGDISRPLRHDLHVDAGQSADDRNIHDVRRAAAADGFARCRRGLRDQRVLGELDGTDDLRGRRRHASPRGVQARLDPRVELAERRRHRRVRRHGVD